jgi:hypothetical protein
MFSVLALLWFFGLMSKLTSYVYNLTCAKFIIFHYCVYILDDYYFCLCIWMLLLGAEIALLTSINTLCN